MRERIEMGAVCVCVSTVGAASSGAGQIGRHCQEETTDGTRHRFKLALIFDTPKWPHRESKSRVVLKVCQSVEESWTRQKLEQI